MPSTHPRPKRRLPLPTAGQKAELLAQLPPMLRPLAEKGELRCLGERELLIREGDTGDTLFILLSGQVRAFARNDKGDELTFGTYSRGEYVGEMSLDGGLRSASVEACEDIVCAMVNRHTLTEHIVQHPEFAFELIGKLIRRARSATFSARQIALNDVYGRIKLTLEGRAVVQPDGSMRIEERLTHQQIAALVGCGRAMVSRVMKDLEKGGLVAHSPEGWLVLARVLPDRW